MDSKEAHTTAEDTQRPANKQIMDVVAKAPEPAADGVQPAPAEDPSEATNELPTPPTAEEAPVEQPKPPKPPKQHNGSVTAAIIATVVIAIALMGFATFAYLKTR